MSGGSSSQQGSSTSFDLTPEEFQALRGPLRDLFLNTIIPGVAGSLSFQSPYQSGNLDQFRVPISQGEQNALSALSASANGSPAEQAGAGLLERTIAGDFLQPSGQNPALAAVIQYTNQAINDAYNQQDLERRALFARSGQQLPESSPFATAQAQSDTGRLRAIGESTANILLPAYEAERQRQTQAVDQARQNAALNLERSVQVLQAEALPRLIDQYGVDQGLKEFEIRLNSIMQALGFASGLSDVSQGQKSSTSSTSKQGGIG